jgi:hypothetical protein
LTGLVLWIHEPLLQGAELARAIFSELPPEVIPEWTGDSGLLPDSFSTEPVIACQLWITAGEPRSVVAGGWEYFLVVFRDRRGPDTPPDRDLSGCRVLLQFLAIDTPNDDRPEWTVLAARRIGIVDRVKNLVR